MFQEVKQEVLLARSRQLLNVEMTRGRSYPIKMPIDTECLHTVRNFENDDFLIVQTGIQLKVGLLRWHVADEIDLDI